MGDLTANKIFQNQKIIDIRLVLYDRTKRFSINLCNIFYFFNSPSNLVSLSLPNNARIFYNNKHQALYNKIN